MWLGHNNGQQGKISLKMLEFHLYLGGGNQEAVLLNLRTSLSLILAKLHMASEAMDVRGESTTATFLTLHNFELLSQYASL